MKPRSHPRPASKLSTSILAAAAALPGCSSSAPAGYPEIGDIEFVVDSQPARTFSAVTPEILLNDSVDASQRYYAALALGSDGTDIAVQFPNQAVGSYPISGTTTTAVVLSNTGLSQPKPHAGTVSIDGNDGTILWGSFSTPDFCGVDTSSMMVCHSISGKFAFNVHAD